MTVDWTGLTISLVRFKHKSPPRTGSRHVGGMGGRHSALGGTHTKNHVGWCAWLIGTVSLRKPPIVTGLKR